MEAKRMLNSDERITRESAQGFTLIEIMITIAIIGLLTSIGVLSVRKAMTNSRNKAAETELSMLSTAVLQLAWDTGCWPSGDKRTVMTGSEVLDLSAYGTGMLADDTNHVFRGWAGPYYNDNLEDPWGRSYFFHPNYPVAGGVPVVVSLGADGLRSADDIWVSLDE